MTIDGAVRADHGEETIADTLGAIEARLDGLLGEGAGSRSPVQQSVRYSLLAPGKRLRGLLVVCSARQFGAQGDACLDSACAVEMVHTASLILDDLPSMDDARLRRGRPANHVRFGESAAILAAVALLNEAFRVTACSAQLGAATKVRLVECLSTAVGRHGLVGGQEEDLDSSNVGAELAAVRRIHARKTAALYLAAAEMGALVAGADADGVACGRRCGEHLGLAFQAFDDLIDVLANPAASGKDAGQDGGKATLVSLLGVDGARHEMQHHLEAARAGAGAQDGAPLSLFVDWVAELMGDKLAACELQVDAQALAAVRPAQ